MRHVVPVTLIALAISMLLGAPARATEIVFVGSDGNVWTVSPDGSDARRVTGDATPQAPYRDPSLARDGTVLAARGDAIAGLPVLGTPLSFDAAGDRIVYAFADEAGIPHLRQVGVACVFPAPCDGAFLLPRWVGRNGDFAAVEYADRGIVDIVTRSGVHLWRSFDGFWVTSHGFSGHRWLAELTPAGAEPPVASYLLYLDNLVAPPDGFDPPVGCAFDDFATGSADLSWSPDGRSFTWAGAEGIYVSPAPGESCTYAPTLIVPGGTQPSWGEVEPPQPTPQPAATPPVPVPGTPSPVASVAANVRDLRVRPVNFHGSASVTFRASGPAQVRFTIERDHKRVRSFTRTAAKGINRFRFNARALRPGVYRMTATVAASSPAARALFAIRRSSR